MHTAVMACVNVCDHLLAYLPCWFYTCAYVVICSRARYTLPGRENVLIIPTSYLEERDGSHYYAQVRPYPYPYPYPNHTPN